MNFSIKNNFKLSMHTLLRLQFLLKILICFYCCLISSVFSCGYYLEPLCEQPNPCRSELRLEPDIKNQYCTLSGIKHKTWKTYPIDDSRDQNENCKGINCWKYDNNIKYQLNMDSNQLEYSEPISGSKNPSLTLQAHDVLQDGRYIYVVRTTDGKIAMRHYDQVCATVSHFPLTVRFDYSRFRNPKNYRIRGQNVNSATPCSPSSLLPVGTTCNYLYVRHTQLNGTTPPSDNGYQDSNAWDPVYCAGEIRVHNHKVDRINNQVEDFKPDEKCVSNVLTLLKALDIAIDEHVRAGNYKKVSTSEVFDCKDSQNELVPSVPDSRYHACAYLILSPSTIGGMLQTPFYAGSNICSNKNTIWIWSHSHTCSGQIYSRGAEY